MKRLEGLDYFLDRTVLNELIDAVGQAPTMEAFCNNEAATDCPSKCYQDSFLSVPVAGHHVFLHPPGQVSRPALLHYLMEKAKDPTRTSAIVVTPPAHKHPRLQALLKGFVLLRQYSGGDRIFRKSKEGGCYAHKGQTQVWYDPPEGAAMRTLSAASRVTADTDMLFASQVGGKAAVSLCDTGADTEYISAAFVRQAGLPLPEPPAEEAYTTCAGAQPLRLHGVLRAQFRMGTFSTSLQFVVVDALLPGVDVILGRSFLKSLHGIPDVAGRRLRLRPSGRSAVTVKSLNKINYGEGLSAMSGAPFKAASSGVPELTITTAAQANKALRRGADYLLVHVRAPAGRSAHGEEEGARGAEMAGRHLTEPESAGIPRGTLVNPLRERYNTPRPSVATTCRGGDGAQRTLPTKVPTVEGAAGVAGTRNFARSEAREQGSSRQGTDTRAPQRSSKPPGVALRHEAAVGPREDRASGGRPGELALVADERPVHARGGRRGADEPCGVVLARGEDGLSPSHRETTDRVYGRSGTTPVVAGLTQAEPATPLQGQTGSAVREEGLVPAEVMERLMEEFKDVFPSELPAGLPPDRGTGHVIQLEPNSVAPYRRNRRMSPGEVELCETFVKDLLAKGFIAPSNSPFGAPVMFIPKNSGGYRVVCDWRALNNITVKNRFPLPRIDETLDRLGGAQIFSSLDLNSGYFQIRISEEDAHKTAFTTPFGQYEFKVLGQGLANSPATFQSVMNRIFAPHLYKFVVVYLDDIMIFSRTPEEHVQHLRTVLELLRQHKFYAKREKCSLNKPEVKFLGHLVGREGLRVDPAKVKAVQEWPEPKDVTQVRQFLGLTNYFRKFIKGYATVAAPLTELTKKDCDMRSAWTDVHAAAFKALKDALSTAPVLVIPDFTKPFELISDASLLGTGGVLLQDGQPVAYTSRKFTSAERNYTTTEQEMLGVVNALTEWRCYFGASDLTVVTDHNPLTYFQTQPQLTRRLARWYEFVQQFNFRWQYRAGSQNIADPISRNPALMIAAIQVVTVPARKGKKVPGEELPPPPEPRPRDIMAEIQDGYVTDPSFAADKVNKLYVKKDGFYVHANRVVVPAVVDLRHRIIMECHDPVWCGHGGREKTLDLVQRAFYWPGMAADVKSYVQNCVSCQRNKSSNQAPGGLLQPLEIPKANWEHVSMDFVTNLPTHTDRGYDAILVCVCKLSKMTHFIPCWTDINSEETAKLFRDNIWKLHGLPKKIITDRGSVFTGAFTQALMANWDMRQALSTSFHPQTDGQTERMNRVMEDTLRHYVSEAGEKYWDEYLAMAEFAVNNAYQASIGCSPFMAVYGQHPHTPVSLRIRDDVPSVQRFLQQHEARLASARANLKKAQDRQKAYADRSRRDVKYSRGDLVLLSSKNLHFPEAQCPKFMPKFIGPFRVIDLVGPKEDGAEDPREVRAVKLDLPASYRIHPVFHVSLLKPFRHDGRSPVAPPPEKVDTWGIPTFEVARILAERVRKKGRKEIRQFLVEWVGYSSEHNSWEDEGDFDADELLAEWRRENPGPPQQPAVARTSAGRKVRPQPKPKSAAKAPAAPEPPAVVDRKRPAPPPMQPAAKGRQRRAAPAPVEPMAPVGSRTERRRGRHRAKRGGV